MNIYKLTDRVYEIDSQLNEIDALIEANEGEITEEVATTMEQLEQEREALIKEIIAKPDDYMAWYKNTAADVNALKVAKAEMDKKKKSAEKKLDWIITLLTDAMVINGKEILKEKEGGLFTASFRRSEATEYDEEVVMAPYNEAISQFKASLPAYISIDTKIMVTPLKGMETLPEGFAKVQHKKLNIR